MTRTLEILQTVVDSDKYTHESFTIRDITVSKDFLDVLENLTITSYGPLSFYKSIMRKSPLKDFKSRHIQSNMTKRRV